MRAAQVEDDAVGVGVIGRAIVFAAGDDVVGDDVVEAGLIVEPLRAAVGDGAGPAIQVAVVIDEVVVVSRFFA